MEDPIDFLNKVTEADKLIFGSGWCGPDKMQREWTLIARYESQAGDDGQTVEIYCCALPARAYKITALDGANSIGEAKKGFEMTTGSGMAKLVAELGIAISEGMIDLH